MMTSVLDRVTEEDQGRFATQFQSVAPRFNRDAVRLFLALAGVLLSAGIAFSDVIPVNNPSFETLPVGGLSHPCPGPGCGFSEAPIPGWVNSGASGQYQPGTQDGNFLVFNTIPDGITVAFSDGPTISQTVAATVLSGVTYTLAVDIGYASASDPFLGVAAFDGTADLLINGTQYFASGATPSPGNWSTYTVTYTGKSSDVGDPITIQLNSSGYQADFDNLQLSNNLNSVPEPGAAVPCILGGVLVFLASLVSGFSHERCARARPD